MVREGAEKRVKRTRSFLTEFTKEDIMPKYKKVDDNTIQVIVEKATNLDLAGLIKGREQIAQQIKDLTIRLKSIDDVIIKAEELGIVPKEKDKDVEKKEKK